MKNVTLYDYQQHNSNAIIEAIKAGNKQILLKQAGGSGKTYTLLKTLDFLISEGIIKKAIFCTPRINLTQQTFKQIDAGYYQGDKSKDLHKPIIIANLHTLVKRPLKCDVVVFDEVHLLTSLVNKYKDYKQAIGISATPYTGKGEILPQWENAKTIDHPYSEKWLMDNNRLSPMQYYVVGKPKITSLKVTKSGELTNAQSEEIVKENKLGDIVGSLINKMGADRLKTARTIVSCQNIKHAYLLEQDFRQRGYKTLIVTSKDNQGLKNLEKFKNGSEENILLSVDMVTTGTDIPNITDVVIARIFGSHTNYRQFVLRGTRRYEGKTHFNVWDFGDHFDRLGNPLEAPKLKAFKEKEDNPNCPQKDHEGNKCQGKLYIYDRKVDMEEMAIVLFKKCPICGHKEHSFKDLDYIECSQCNKIHLKDKITLENGYYGVKCDCGNFEAFEKVTSKPLRAVLTHTKVEVMQTLATYIKEPYLSHIVAFTEDKILAYAMEVMHDMNGFYSKKSKGLIIRKLTELYPTVYSWRAIRDALIVNNVRLPYKVNFNKLKEHQREIFFEFKNKGKLTERKINNTLRKYKVIPHKPK